MVVGIVLLVLGIYLGRKHSPKIANECKCDDEIEKQENGMTANDSMINKQAEEKKKNLVAILEFLIKQDKVTNNEVEELLGVSDATAERYLQELETAGQIVQVGMTGQQVYYKKK